MFELKITAGATSLTCAVTVEPIYIADFDFTKSTHTKDSCGSGSLSNITLALNKDRSRPVPTRQCYLPNIVINSYSLITDYCSLFINKKTLQNNFRYSTGL